MSVENSNISSSNNLQNMMGKTVINTVYPIQSQLLNSKGIVESMHIKQEKSQVPNSQNVIKNSKENIQVSNTPNRINKIDVVKNNSKFVKSMPVGKSKVNQTIIKDGKTISNIDLNSDVQNKSLSDSKSSDNQNSQNLNLNKNSPPLNQLQNLGSTIKTQQLNPSLTSQKKSIQQSIINTQIQSKNKIKQNSNINNKSLNIHTQNQNPNVQTIVHPQKQPIQNSNLLLKNQQPSSNNHLVKPGNLIQNKVEPKLLRNSNLRASRNKSPPQLIRTPDGKFKGTKIDSSGNSFFITTEDDKVVSDINISRHLDDYLNKEIVDNIPQETKSQNNKKGIGFRYLSKLTKEGRNQNGKPKINQDTILVHLNVGDIPGFNLFGVLDGHGPLGHLVSQFCRDYFIKVMTKYAESCKKSKLITPESIYNELRRTNFAYIVDAFKKADTHMKCNNNVDCYFSGTTCNLVLQLNKNLICASVGDSRAILIYDRGDSQNNCIFPLSYDHKPDLPIEKNRIQLNGGVVDQITDAFGNKVGPQRVWKSGVNYPGLAMSRSLGDLQAKELGVIADPQIIEYTINHSSRYMVICSDGVWEYIQNEQVRDLGNAFYKINDVGGFCTNLVKFAVHSWEQFDIIRDDITAVCIYF